MNGIVDAPGHAEEVDAFEPNEVHKAVKRRNPRAVIPQLTFCISHLHTNRTAAANMQVVVRTGMMRRGGGGGEEGVQETEKKIKGSERAPW